MYQQGVIPWFNYASFVDPTGNPNEIADAVEKQRLWRMAYSCFRREFEEFEYQNDKKLGKR